MARTWGSRKLVIAEDQRTYCKDLAAGCDPQATQYDAMAADEAEAKE